MNYREVQTDAHESGDQLPLRNIQLHLESVSSVGFGLALFALTRSTRVILAILLFLLLTANSLSVNATCPQIDPQQALQGEILGCEPVRSLLEERLSARQQRSDEPEPWIDTEAMIQKTPGVVITFKPLSKRSYIDVYSDYLSGQRPDFVLSKGDWLEIPADEASLQKLWWPRGMCGKVEKEVRRTFFIDQPCCDVSPNVWTECVVGLGIARTEEDIRAGIQKDKEALKEKDAD